jgi:WD40 repeat protein
MSIRSLAITEDGKRALSGDVDGDLKLWDIERGSTIISVLDHHDEISSIKVSANASAAISGSHDGTVRVWDVKAGTVKGTLTGHQGRVNAVGITSDGRVGVSASQDKTIRIWDISTNSVRHILRGHREKVTCIALGGDGRFAVSAACSYFDKLGVGNISIRDLVFGMKRGFFGAVGERGFLGHEDYTVCVWDIRRGVLHKQLLGHEGWIWSVAVSPDCAYVISGSQDCTVRVWRIEDGRLIATFYGEDGITCVAAGRADLFLAGSANGAVHILRLHRDGQAVG